MGSSSGPSSVDGVLDIALHHARNIPNICIYGNQDVYAKFFITDTQDAVYSTQPIRGGGKNPDFNQSLQVLMSKIDAVLKCEIWMMSCVRTYLEDQLLGFVLIPLSDVFGQGRVTKDYLLSATELFHTPAGTVCLSLTFYLLGANIPLYPVCSNTSSSCSQNDLHNLEGNAKNDTTTSVTHDIISADITHDTSMNGDQCLNPLEYNNIEFPELQDACETQHLVSVYVNMASGTDATMDANLCGKEHQCNGMRVHVNERGLSGASFLQLGSSQLIAENDSEMSISHGEEKMRDGLWSPSCDTCLQEDVNLVSSEDSPTILKAKEIQFLGVSPASTIQVPTQSAQKTIDSQENSSSMTTMSCGGMSSPIVQMASGSQGQESQSSCTVPLVTVPLEPEDSVIQQQIVDMYTTSMQQFTGSLANMKLPLDLNNVSSQAELNNESQVENKEPTNKDGHKVFYGSRAFF